MIYLVSKQTSLFDYFPIISSQTALDLLYTIPLNENGKRLVGADTETTGLNCLKNEILTIQLGIPEFQIVWDCTTVPIKLLKDFIEDNSTITVWWNALFDLQFLYHNDIWPRNLYDGMIAEQLINNGYSYKKLLMDVKQELGPEYTPFSLKTAAKRYCDKELDKSVRGKIIQVGLTPDTIIYSARDVEFELPIIYKQMNKLTQQGSLNAFKMECMFTPCLAYYKFCGVKLDVPRWKKKMQNDLNNLNTYKSQLDKWVIDYYNSNSRNGNIVIQKRVGVNIDGKYKDLPCTLPENYMVSGFQETEYIEGKRAIYNVGVFEIPFGFYDKKTFVPYIYRNLQGDLFDGFDTEQHCSINWNSQPQVIPLFELLGFKLDTIDKKTKKPKKSVGSDIISAQKGISDISVPYLKYKKAYKLVSSYGQKWIDAIDVDGRIHPEYHQIGTNTCRVSSGSGNSDDDDAMNILNLPRDAETRACFICEEGNAFISEDYKSQESRILASVSKDKEMLALYEDGKDGDMHSLVAKKSYKSLLKDCPVDDIKRKFPDARQNAKKIEFSVCPIFSIRRCIIIYILYNNYISYL